MANLTHFLLYTIHFTDKAAYDAAVASVPPAGFLVDTAPDTASATYSKELILPGAYMDGDHISSPWFGSSANYPTNVGVFTRKSGGWFGIPFLFGDTHTYRWTGQFNYWGAPPGETEIPTEPALTNMPTRLWVDGFENGEASGSLSGNGNAFHSPLASRHLGGFGMAMRNGTSHTIQHSITESGGAANNRAWERIYVRLRHAPNTSQTFWQTAGAISGQAGVRLRFSISGQIEAVNCDSVGTLSTMGTTTALELNRWYKLDILYRAGAAPDSFFKLYIGGVQAVSVNGSSLPVATGLTQVQNVASSEIRSGQTTGHDGAWDFDDWIGSNLPAGGANPALFPQRDWNTGSKVVALRGASAAASNTGNWAGPGGANANDWRITTQRPVLSTLAQGLTTTSASQRLAVVSDAARMIDYDPQNRGLASASIGAVAIKTVGGANDRLYGLKLPTAAEVQVGATQNEGITLPNMGRGNVVHPGGLLECVQPMSGTELSYTCNSTAAVSKTLYNLIAQVECLGNFYIEDYVPQAGDPASITDGFPLHWVNDLHQHSFQDGPWASANPPRMPSIVVIHGKTYVGNGTSQLITFRTPPTWIQIRNTASNEQTTWFVSGPSATTSSHESTRSSSIPRVYIDPNFAPVAEDDQSQQTVVVIAGNNVAINQNAVTYNILAWCDAGQRFSEAGALVEHSAHTNARETLLNEPTFTPEFLVLQRIDTGNATTPDILVKGLGLAANQINLVNAASIATGIAMGAGTLTNAASSGLYSASQVQHTMLAMRRDDGSGDPGVANVMQLASWTGDGTASRTINLAPITGRRPMWGMVVGSNGNARIRDASHTGTNSVNMASDGNTTDGITAGGIDSFSVGAALNVNAVLYEAIIFPSCDATSGANGWGVNCENIPVEPRTPPCTTCGENPENPPEVPTEPCEGTPGLVPTGTITQCAGPSTLVINMALSRIGISKQLTSTTLNTEVSAEATTARLHFDEDVRQILRDFPWPFATRYATLTQIMGPARESDTVQAYSATQAYLKNSVVRVSGIDYYCILAHSTAQAVTNPTYWTTEAPEEANGDWLYAYRQPAFCIFSRRVVNNSAKTRRDWDQTPPDFKVGSDANGPLIYSNELNAELEFTIIDGCVANQGDALFRSALAWRHAHSIAPALARDAKTVADCWEMYQRLLRDARGSGAQEQQQPHQGDPDWITGRN